MKAWQPVRFVPDLLCYYELTATKCFVCLFCFKRVVGEPTGFGRERPCDFLVLVPIYFFYLPTFFLMGKGCFHYVISSKHPNMFVVTPSSAELWVGAYTR
jgi:hypothetical protein